MITNETLAEFFGWCTMINFGVLILSSTGLMVFRKPIARMHAGMFGVSEYGLTSVYFRYLGNYKIAILMLNLVPYLALKLMA